MKYPAEGKKGKQSKDIVQPQRADSVNTWFFPEMLKYLVFMCSTVHCIHFAALYYLYLR